jgi:hypothetical protein
MATTNMRYEESSLIDKKSHNNYIEKIYYFERIDIIVLYEQNMKKVVIYSGVDLSWIQDIDCQSNILAIEYCTERNVIAISLADLNIVFFEGKIFAKKEETTQIKTRLHVPQTQKCLRYIHRKTGGDLLFTASVSGSIFAFNLQDLFN